MESHRIASLTWGFWKASRLRLLHWDFVDEGVSLHRDDDVGGLHRALRGAVGPL